MPATIGRYQLLEPIGTGTLGPLHRARDLQKGRTVALRLVDPALPQSDRAELRERALRLVDLSHPVVASLYECIDEGETLALASEFVPGQSLAAMTAGAPLNPRRAVDLAIQIADGLAAAHALDLVHGALSVDAVIVTPKGTPKLLDVGLTRWTRAGATAQEDDLAGLAAVLFALIVGRPLKRGWPAEFRDAMIPRALQPVLQKLSTSGGYDSMVLAAADLREVASSLDAGEKPAETPRVASRSQAAPTEPTPSSSSTGWWLVVAVIVVIAIASVAIAKVWVERALY